MKGGTTASGYTIVEVMIFLAVTGILFVVAMVMINGQQNKANFAQGVRDFQAAIDDSINDIRNGNFPQKSGNYVCTVATPSSPTSPPSFGIGAPADDNTVQGSHEKCVFLGKVVQYGSNWDRAEVYTTVGRRLNASGKDPENFAQALPVIPTGSDALRESFTIQGGLNVKSIRFKTTAPVPYSVWAIGFFNSFTNSNNPLNPQNNGLVTVLPVQGTTDGSSGGDPASVVDGASGWVTATADADAGLAKKIVICLQQGSGGKVAALIIGENGDSNTTSLHIDDADTAANNILGGTLNCST